MLTTAKQDALKVLKGLPDDAALEDIQYHLYVLQRVTQGREDVAAGRLVPQDEFERRIASVARRVAWTQMAWRDLARIADQVAEDSPGYVAAFVRRVRIGRSRSPSTPSVAELGDVRVRELIGSYRLIYEVAADDVYVLA